MCDINCVILKDREDSHIKFAVFSRRVQEMSTVISLYSQEIFIVCSKCGQQMLIVFSWCSHKMFFYDCWLGQGLFCLLLIWLMNVLCFHHKQEYFNTVVQTYRSYHWVMWPLFQVPISLLTKRGRPGVIKLMHEDFRKLHNSLPHANQISNQARHSVWIWAILYICPLKNNKTDACIFCFFEFGIPWYVKFYWKYIFTVH